MPSRRELIRMSHDEAVEFLREPHTMAVATHGPDGDIHLVAMWYGFIADAVAFWTYGKSQKIVNLRRDPRITCLVEDGDSYDTLRGVELKGRATVFDDEETIMAVGRSVHERYNGPFSGEVEEVIRQMGRKRVAVRIDVDHMVTWDHTKLGGAY